MVQFGSFLKDQTISMTPWHAIPPYLSQKKKTCTHAFTVVLIARHWKQLKYPSTGEWIHIVAYPYNEILLSKKVEGT